MIHLLIVILKPLQVVITSQDLLRSVQSVAPLLEEIVDTRVAVNPFAVVAVPNGSIVAITLQNQILAIQVEEVAEKIRIER